MNNKDLARIMCLERLQTAVMREEWCEFRLVFHYYHTQFPDEARALYQQMPQKFKNVLFQYKRDQKL